LDNTVSVNLGLNLMIYAGIVVDPSQSLIRSSTPIYEVALASTLTEVLKAIHKSEALSSLKHTSPLIANAPILPTITVLE
jgi:hypothetical protein